MLIKEFVKTHNVSKPNRIEVLRFDNYNIIEFEHFFTYLYGYYEPLEIQKSLTKAYFNSLLEDGCIAVNYCENGETKSVFVDKNNQMDIPLGIINYVIAWIQHIDTMLKSEFNVETYNLVGQFYILIIEDEHMRVRFVGSKKFLIGFFGKDKLNNLIK